MQTITCPVCKQPEIEGDFCLRCDTDLSLMRMLVELTPSVPSVSTLEQTRQQLSKILISSSLAILLLIIGITLGVASSYLFSQSPLPINATVYPKPQSLIQQNISSENSKLKDKNLQCLNGFWYKVRSGDYLSLIAGHFYGDENLWKIIANANPNIKAKNNVLNEGEILLIPNQEEFSCGHL